MKYRLNLLLLLVVFTPCLAQKFKPELNLVKGDTYYMASTGTSAIVQSVNGQENKVNIVISSRMAFNVTGIKDSVYTMEVIYQSLETKIQMADTTIDMDSKKNSPLDIPSSIIAAMMNKPFYITLTRSGKIKSVENIGKMITGVFDGFPQIDTAKKEQIKNSSCSLLGQIPLKAVWKWELQFFPKLR